VSSVLIRFVSNWCIIEEKYKKYFTLSVNIRSSEMIDIKQMHDEWKMFSERFKYPFAVFFLLFIISYLSRYLNKSVYLLCFVCFSYSTQSMRDILMWIGTIQMTGTREIMFSIEKYINHTRPIRSFARWNCLIYWN
jgi:hypothetical protein